MEKLYETREVAKILQLSQRRIINWAERAFIAPAKEGKGPGIRRQYSFDNIVKMKIMNDLILLGLDLRSIAGYLAQNIEWEEIGCCKVSIDYDAAERFVKGRINELNLP